MLCTQNQIAHVIRRRKTVYLPLKRSTILKIQKTLCENFRWPGLKIKKKKGWKSRVSPWRCLLLIIVEIDVPIRSQCSHMHLLAYTCIENIIKTLQHSFTCTQSVVLDNKFCSRQGLWMWVSLNKRHRKMEAVEISTNLNLSELDIVCDVRVSTFA